jgi:ComF family protein
MHSNAPQRLILTRPLTRSCARRLGWLADAALELLWPTRCAGCEQLGALLCERCTDALSRIDQDFACPRCGAPAGRLVCTECTPVYEQSVFTFSQARCAVEFSEITRRIIIAYKDGGERRLASLLARLLADVIPAEWRRWADALTWVPADSQALRRRGFDHMELIARALAAQTGLRVLPTLMKQARADQRGLGRSQRKTNTGRIFSVGHLEALLPGLQIRHLILIDDVFTTGATLDAASRALRAAKIQEIRVATVARVW